MAEAVQGRAVRGTVIAVVLLIGAAGTGVALHHRFEQDDWYLKDTSCTARGNTGLVGFDAQTGAVRWTDVTRDEGRVATRGDEVILTTGPSRTQQSVREQTVDTRTGALSGCTEVDTPPADDPATSRDLLPIEHDGLTIVAWGDGLRATDADGTGVWGVEDVQAFARHGADGVLVESFDEEARTAEVALLDLATGEAAWRVDGWRLRTKTDGPLVLATGSDDAMQVSAVDPDDGSTTWSTDVSTKGGVDVNEAIALDGLLVLPRPDGGHVTVLDAETGELRWTGDGKNPAMVGREYDGSDRPGTYTSGALTSVALSPDGQTLVASVRAYDPIADN